MRLFPDAIKLTLQIAQYKFICYYLSDQRQDFK